MPQQGAAAGKKPPVHSKIRTGVRFVYGRGHARFVDERNKRIVYTGIHNFISRHFQSSPPAAGAGAGAGGGGDGTNHRYGKQIGLAAGANIARWANSAGTWRPGAKSNRFARAFIERCGGEWGLEPIAGELSVCYRRLSCATSIDCVLRRKSDGRIFCVEIKCGHNGTWDRPYATGGLCAPLSAHMRHTPQTRAIIQACIGTFCFNASAGSNPAAGSDGALPLVVRLSNTQNGPRDSHVECELIVPDPRIIEMVTNILCKLPAVV